MMHNPSMAKPQAVIPVERFPRNFAFQLTRAEFDSLRTALTCPQLGS